MSKRNSRLNSVAVAVSVDTSEIRRLLRIRASLLTEFTRLTRRAGASHKDRSKINQRKTKDRWRVRRALRRNSDMIVAWCALHFDRVLPFPSASVSE